MEREIVRVSEMYFCLIWYRGSSAVNGLLNENVVLLIFVLIFYWSLLAVHAYNCMYTYACCFLAYLYI